MKMFAQWFPEELIVSNSIPLEPTANFTYMYVCACMQFKGIDNDLLY